MGEKKTTVFEINVENFDFNPDTSGLQRALGAASEGDEGSTGSKLGLFGSADGEVEEDVEIDEEEATEVDVEDEEAENGGGGIGIVIGLFFLLIVAVVAKKFVLDSETEEYEEVELSDYEN